MQGTHESRQKVKHMAVATTSVFPRDTFPLLRLRHGVHVVRSYGPRSGGAFTVLTFKGASRYGAGRRDGSRTVGYGDSHRPNAFTLVHTFSESNNLHSNNVSRTMRSKSSGCSASTSAMRS
jgi:hypothetical protein